jgi:TetR/AcrR family transcriptional repressor of nem operon
MARPREFDEEAVLDSALRTFWEKGYEGTSVEDLVQATGLGRASLYGAFGDKEQLFGRVLERYLGGAESVTSIAKDESLPAPEILARIMRGRLGETCGRSSPKGCFLLLAGTAGDGPPAAREALTASLHQLERLLADVIRRGTKRGEIRGAGDPVALARFLVVVMQGVSASARAGWGQERLRAVVDEALAHVIGEAPAKVS